MNMMEDIKIKLKDSEFVAVDFTVEEVEYLLSKLEIAEKALEKAFDAEGYSFLEEALQHIRE